jgi:hypothetical protein
MSWLECLAGLLVSVLQVPPPAPSLSTDAARELEAVRVATLSREDTELSHLAEELQRCNDSAAARQVQERLGRRRAPDGPSRFVPLPEVVPAPGATPANAPSPAQAKDGTTGSRTSPEPWRAKVTEIRSQAARELIQLAQRAARAEPPRFALASFCLRAVLEREPDHPEARRLLGYVPFQGGWARPFAIRQLRDRYVSHPIFGWVPSEWVPHLDAGELPAPQTRGQKKPRWLPAAEADRLRAGWNPPWRIATEHFEIQTDVTLAEAISFGRRLEAFHELFMTLLADILGENLPLVRRFRDPKLAGEGPYKPHVVFYFGSKDEYIEYFRNKPEGESLVDSLGYYSPPKTAGRRAPAYFFRDPNGQLPVTANLYHEVSHQLLFETAGTNAYTRNAGNYWVFEGLGTYFETVSPQPDGSIEVGGLVGPRIEAALTALVDQGRTIPLAAFVTLGKDDFERDGRRKYLYYQQAMALTVFLMQWHSGAHRDAFLDYAHDAYRGRIKARTGRSLQDRLGEPYATLEEQLLAFLKGGRSRARNEIPAPPVKPSTAIRTVPSE